jgi:hypothetical protein
MGLGRDQARARLERVEALHRWKPIGTIVYQDGCVLPDIEQLPLFTPDQVSAYAAALSHNLRLTLQTPLRLKWQGRFIDQIIPAALVQAICWRASALAAFHGNGPWEDTYRPIVDEAASVTAQQDGVRWQEWSRTSRRGGKAQKMQLGGMLGSAVLHDVPPSVRAVLLLGSLIHAGKACVFGHGGYHLAAARLT